MATSNTCTLLIGLPGFSRAWAVLILFCLILFIGLNLQADDSHYKANNSKLSAGQERILEHFMNSKSGVIFAFNDTVSAATSDLMMEYYLSEPSYLPITMTFYSLEPDNQDYYIFCLVDYMLTPCASDNKKQLAHKISYPPKTKSDRTFNLKIPSTGRHDITIVGVNISSYSRGREAPIRNILYRANVIVKEDTIPTVAYGAKSNDCKKHNNALSLEPKSDDGLDIFYMGLNTRCTKLWNSHQEHARYAIVSLSITETNENEIRIDSELIYMKAEPKELIYFSSPNIDSDTDTFKLNLAIENPYAKLEKPVGKVNQISSAILISNIISYIGLK